MMLFDDPNDLFLGYAIGLELFKMGRVDDAIKRMKNFMRILLFCSDNRSDILYILHILGFQHLILQSFLEWSMNSDLFNL
jgi:hypothetical protein